MEAGSCRRRLKMEIWTRIAAMEIKKNGQGGECGRDLCTPTFRAALLTGATVQLKCPSMDE